MKKDYGSQLIQHVMSTLNENIKCNYIAKIVKLYPPYADIQPLAIYDGQKQNMVSKASFMTVPLYYKIPAKTDIESALNNKDDKGDIQAAYKAIYEDLVKSKMFHKPKLNYKVGDNVMVAVLDHDNQSFTNKSTFNSSNIRKHAIDFSVIIGKIASKGDFKK